MKALIIKPVEKTIEPIDISSTAQIAELIGYDTVIADDVGDDGDKLYFDEECFLRGIEGRFQVDSLVPVSGVGIVIGSSSNNELGDVSIDVQALAERTKFI